MNPAAARRERILDAWAKGAKARTLARAEFMTEGQIKQIIKVARDAGDGRAAARDGGKIGNTDPRQCYSKSELCSFDYKFKGALLAAIAAGKERCEIGVYKAAPRKRQA